MRTETVTTNIYTYDELSDDAKQRAREWYCEGALDHEWWDCTYEDAENIGCKIESFDCDRGEIDLRATEYDETVATCILRDHGDSCDTYQTAVRYKKALEKLRDAALAAPTEGHDDAYYLDEYEDEAGGEFIKELGQDYLVMLRKECEYLTSEEAVEESILANGYEFTEDGERY